MLNIEDEVMVVVTVVIVEAVDRWDNVAQYSELLSILLPCIGDFTWNSILQFRSELRRNANSSIRAVCTINFRRSHIAIFQKYHSILLVEDPDREKLYLRNNIVLYKPADRIGMPRFLTSLIPRFSFPVLQNTRYIGDFEIQIAICLNPKIRYCNMLWQYIVIGLYFTTPLTVV